MAAKSSCFADLLKSASKKYLKEPLYDKSADFELLKSNKLEMFAISELIKSQEMLAPFSTTNTVRDFISRGALPVSWFVGMYFLEGVQMRITRNVAEDLILSDFEQPAEDLQVPWPAKSVEIFFEDSDLPSILLSKYTISDIIKLFRLDSYLGLNSLDAKIFSRSQVSIIAWGAQKFKSEKIMLADTLQLDVEEKTSEQKILKFSEDFLEKEKNSIINFANLDDSNLSLGLFAELIALVSLAFRAFVFSSIPVFKPQPVKLSDISKKQGGKPCFLGRPARPALRVIYAPSVIRERAKFSENGKTRQFKGRRGHFHFYKSDRFVNRKGTWDYYPPIYVNNLSEQTVYVVRKP